MKSKQKNYQLVMHYKSSCKENVVLFTCLRALRMHGIYAWRNNSGALRNIRGGYVTFGKPGSSDIIGILPSGKFLAVECKRPVGGRVSEKQQIFLDIINREGGIGIVAHSAQEMIEQLQALGEMKEK